VEITLNAGSSIAMANGEHKKTQPNNKNLFMGGFKKKNMFPN
jgi:hypothetical protein